MHCLSHKNFSKYSFLLIELDKDVRPWELYNNIEAEVRNMMASLRAVSELQNPAIRDRHWRELMAETKVINTVHGIVEKLICY